MKHFKIILLLLTLSLAGKAQTKTADTTIYSSTIKKQANIMADLLVKKKYKAFSKYTYPRVMEMMGGKKEMIKSLEKSTKSMEAEGFAFLSVSIGEPENKVCKNNNELQCIVPETITMKAPGGKMIKRSSLIAISTDNGKNWYFVDASSNDLETIRGILPNLSEDLIIPAKQEPVFQKD